MDLRSFCFRERNPQGASVQRVFIGVHQSCFGRSQILLVALGLAHPDVDVLAKERNSHMGSALLVMFKSSSF